MLHRVAGASPRLSLSFLFPSTIIDIKILARHWTRRSYLGWAHCWTAPAGFLQGPKVRGKWCVWRRMGGGGSAVLEGKVKIDG